MPMTLNCSFLSILPTLTQALLALHNALQLIFSSMTANLLTLNSSMTEFLIIRLKKQLAKIHNSSINTTQSASNLGFICDEHFSLTEQISSLSRSFCYHIRQLHSIRPYLDSKTACTVAISTVHSKFDYCNSL